LQPILPRGEEVIAVAYPLLLGTIVIVTLTTRTSTTMPTD
jgi:hypothetical protein